MPQTPLDWRRWWMTRTATDIDDVQLAFYGANMYWGGRYFATSLFPANEDYGFWEKLAEARRTGKGDTAYLNSWMEQFKGLPENYVAELRAHFNQGLINWAPNQPFNTADTKKYTHVVPYTNPRGCITENRAFVDTYRDEWQRVDVADPGWGKGEHTTRQSQGVAAWYDIEPVPSFVDMALFYHKKMYETFADGIYWDNFFLKPCFIPAEAGGPAYVDDKGRLQPGVNLTAFRNLAKRNAVMMHVMGRRPLSYIHMTNVNIVPMLSFGTINLDWEWRDQGGMAKEDLQTRLGADQDTSLILAQSMGLQSGNISVGASRFTPPKGSPITSEWLHRTVMAVSIPHEIKIDYGTEEVSFVQRYLARFGYGHPECKVYRYWEKGFPLKTEGANMRALVLARGGRALIALGNYGPTTEGVQEVAARAADGPSLADYDAGQRNLQKTNIALSARVKASSQHSAPYDARHVIDGKVPPALSKDDAGLAWAAGKKEEQASLTFTWQEPVPLATLVYYGRTAWGVDMCWKDYEIYVDNQTTPLVKGTFERKHGPQPVNLPETATARELVLKLLSHYSTGGSPGASEVQIFSERPTTVDFLSDSIKTETTRPRAEHRVYTVVLKLDLDELGLAEAAEAHDVELRAGKTKTENLRAVKLPAMPGHTDILADDDPGLDLALEDKDPSLLKRLAPGVFELKITTHDFALIELGE